MAGTKTSGFALSDGPPDAADIVGFVDVSTGTNEKMTITQLAAATPFAGAGLTLEEVRDDLAAVLVAGANVTITVNDGADTITIESTGGGGGGVTLEQVQDDLGNTSLVAGTGITKTYNDGANTITLAIDTTAEAERARDTIGAALVAGANVTITVNDAGDTITIASTGGGGGGATNLTWTAATSIVASDTGTDATLTAADGTNPGLMTSAQFTKLAAIEALADVTDPINVEAAGALMDSEVDSNIKSLTLPAVTTITTFIATLLDDIDAPTARATLGVPASADVAETVVLTAVEYAALTPVAETIYYIVG